MFLFLKDRERKRKDQMLDGYGDGEDLAGTGGRENIKIYCKEYFFLAIIL